MSVLCLKKIHYQAVCGQTSHENILCLSQSITEIYLEKFLQSQRLSQTILQLLFEFVEGDGVLDHFNDAAIRSHRQDLIGSEYER